MRDQPENLRALVIIILRDVQSIVIVLLFVVVVLRDFSFHLLLLGEAKVEQLCSDVVVVALHNERPDTSQSAVTQYRRRS